MIKTLPPSFLLYNDDLLEYYVRNGKLMEIQALFLTGASPNMLPSGQSLLDIAAEVNNADAAKIIIKYGGKPKYNIKTLDFLFSNGFVELVDNTLNNMSNVSFNDFRELILNDRLAFAKYIFNNPLLRIWFIHDFETACDIARRYIKIDKRNIQKNIAMGYFRDYLLLKKIAVTEFNCYVDEDVLELFVALQDGKFDFVTQLYLKDQLLPAGIS